MRPRVIALGQPMAGDDGAGPAVLDQLREEGFSRIADLVTARDASELIELLVPPGLVVVIDAVLSWPPGEVLLLSPREIETANLDSVSSHSLSAGQCIALARLLGAAAAPVRLVAVTIGRPAAGSSLSPAVALAIGDAARAVRELLYTATGSGTVQTGAGT